MEHARAAPSRAEVMHHIEVHTREGSLCYTGEWQACATLKLCGGHVVMRKEKGRPPGRDHINGIEGFRSYAKNWLYPCRGVPRKQFHLYLGEICYRYNHRAEDLHPLIITMSRQTPLEHINQIPNRKQ